MATTLLQREQEKEDFVTANLLQNEQEQFTENLVTSPLSFPSTHVDVEITNTTGSENKNLGRSCY